MSNLLNQFSEALNSDANNVDFIKERKRSRLVFEELFDAGHSLIVKSSLVDPIFSVLFADNVATLLRLFTLIIGSELLRRFDSLKLFWSA